METAEKVVNKMMGSDWYSQWLGIQVLQTGPGICKLQMTVRKEMLNGFGIAHGGITYSLADSALAFASNSHGVQSVSIETSISHTTPVKEGDILTAVAEESTCSKRIGVYHVKVVNQESATVALFKGTVYRTGKEWEV
jgi:acyl-CoA thioesterase